PPVTIDSTSTLDLADNDMALLYGTAASPFTTIRGLIQHANDGQLWDLPGITSSIAKGNPANYAVGYAEASVLGLSTFDNVTLGANAVLVKYTLRGDTTLKGSVGLQDYNTVLA